MTASLVGFVKVPAYERVFDERPKDAPSSTDDLFAFFSAFSGVNVVKR